MHFRFVTLFPEVIESYFQAGIISRALEKQLISCETLDPRNFAEGVHRAVDDRPFGGGDGMVMMGEPLKKSVESFEARGPIVVLSAAGRPFDQDLADQWAQSEKELTLVSGRYGGIDERFVAQYADEEISLGDFVLSGGELGALVIADTVSRQIPGVLGSDQSAKEDSFSLAVGQTGFRKRLEAPAFTRPSEWGQLKVPEVLMGGHHRKIEEFRLAVSQVRTYLRRPELWNPLASKESLVASWEFLSENHRQDLLSLNIELKEFESLGRKLRQVKS